MKISIGALAFFFAAATTVQAADGKVQSFSSIGAGPFEFPIAGDFVVSRESGATAFSEKGGRRYLVGFFRRRASQGENQASEIEAVTRKNWERFAETEKGSIVVPFQRQDLPNGVTVLSMATEFAAAKSYYVQFAVLEGVRLATVFVEGEGAAKAEFERVMPIVYRVKVVP